MSGSEPEAHVPSASVWEASPIGQEWHENWDAFNSYLGEYQERTHQLFRLRSSTSVARRNTEIKAHGAIADNTSGETSDSPPSLIPDEFKTYWMKLICTHGWRRKSRSTGQRKSYFGKSTECKADIKAAVTWNRDKQKFMVRVTGYSISHNHRVDRAVYENHSSVRRVEDPMLLAFVDVLQASGSKPKRIMQFLREKTGQNVTLRDVHNMVARMREKRRGSGTVEQRHESLMREFCGRRGNRASVFVDDESLAQTITLQTRQMRRWFKAFPEVLLIDATHNTNDSRYKLFSFMIHDVYGHYVQHSLMENESAECLTDAIESFKFSNPSWEEIRVIVIDKDMGELSLLEAHFPNVKVILCHFHLKKYIRSEMAKSEYGGPSSFDMDQVEDAVDMMRTATTSEDYTRYLKYLYFLLDNVQLCSTDAIPDPKHPFLRYFMKNWDQQKERWALYACSDVPHLGNHTNNRLEASWGHLKEILKPEMPLDECVDTLIFLQAVAEMEYSKNMTAVGYMRYQGADKELERLSQEVSPHAYRQIEQQYWIAKDRATHYEVTEVTPNMFTVSCGSDNNVYHVDTSIYRCSCVFMRTTLLPCRHVMYWRLSNGKNVIPIRHIAQRWRLSCKLNQPAEEEDAPQDQIARKSFQIRESMMVSSKHKVLNGTTKFSTACRRGTQIADIMSRNGTAVFNEMLAALDKFEEIIKDGVAPFVGREGQWFDPLSQLSISSYDLPSAVDASGTTTSDQELDPVSPKILEQSPECDYSDDVPQTHPHLCDSMDTETTTTDAVPGSINTVTSNTNGVATSTTGTPPVATRTSGVAAGTIGEAAVATGTDGVPTGSQKGSTVPTVTEDTNRAKDVETAPTSILSKRHPTSSASENSDTSTPATFTISKSAKSRGRPKVRKQQKVSDKKERMTRGMEKATKLVQGTLVPVPSLNNLVKLLDRDYRYIDIKSSTQSLSERSVPQSKKAIAGIFTSEESENDIRYIFPQWFVTKAQSAIQQFRKAVPVDCGEDDVGVRVPRFGIYQLRDINAMDRWHRALKCITDVEDTVVWAVNTSNKRLSLPDELWTA